MCVFLSKKRGSEHTSINKHLKLKNKRRHFLHLHATLG
jgi:hypothetical protein